MGKNQICRYGNETGHRDQSGWCLMWKNACPTRQSRTTLRTGDPGLPGGQASCSDLLEASWFVQCVLPCAAWHLISRQTKLGFEILKIYDGTDQLRTVLNFYHIPEFMAGQNGFHLLATVNVSSRTTTMGTSSTSALVMIISFG